MSKPRKPLPFRPPAKKETHWGQVANWYDQLVGAEGSEYHRQVIIPGLLRLLDVKDKPLRVLDLACGQGVLARRLAEEGCDVVGIDAAERLIAAARGRAGEIDVEYRVGDATKMVDENGQLKEPWSGLRPFDAVTIVLAIQNMTPLSPIWQACRGMLKPSGRLIVVMMHPCFRVPQRSDWMWIDGPTPAAGKQVRAVERYLGSEKIAITTHPGLHASGQSEAATTHFHRPLQAYINTLGNAGLLIDHVEEWPSHKSSQAGPRKEALDRSRKEIPMFLALQARRTT